MKKDGRTSKHGSRPGIEFAIAATAATFLSFSALREVPLNPWLAGLLWLIPFGVSAHAIFLLPLNVYFRSLAWATVFLIAYAFWQATTPHAILRVVKYELVPHGGAGSIQMNVVVQNTGSAAATVQVFHATAFARPPMNIEKQQEIELSLQENIRKRMIKPLGISIQILPEDKKFFTVESASISKEQMSAFDDRQLFFFFAGILSYKDWWIWSRSTAFCSFNNGDPKIIFTCTAFNELN